MGLFEQEGTAQLHRYGLAPKLSTIACCIAQPQVCLCYLACSHTQRISYQMHVPKYLMQTTCLMLQILLLVGFVCLPCECIPFSVALDALHTSLWFAPTAIHLLQNFLYLKLQSTS